MDDAARGQVGTDRDHRHGYDVAVVGGGPAGCSAGVFTARYGLDTVVLDRGRSSIRRCAHLENYLGFPGGIGVETLYGLMHDHAEAAGCELRDDLVESVDRFEDVRRTASAEPAGASSSGDGDGFVVTPQEGEPITARRVVAATRYGGEYLRGLDDETAMFETNEHDGETHEHLDTGYAGSEGGTPVEGLFVASPAEFDHQAIVAAGRGARVGVAVVEAVRRERGYPELLVDYYDWVRREAELDGEWADRDRWRQWFDERLPDDHDLDGERLVELREREVDRRLDSYLLGGEIDRRAERGHDRLLEHVDDERILAAAREIEAGRQAASPDGGDRP